MPRSTDQRLYKRGFWQRRRKLQLAEYPFCAPCAALGKLTLATLVDHDVPHHGDPNAFVLGKLTSMCWSCHSRGKQRAEIDAKRGYSEAIGVDGWPLDPRHPSYERARGG
jgi:hypothetical protein